MLNAIVRNWLKFLSKKSLRRYETKLIVLYGWDWTELLGDALHNIVSENWDLNSRRNKDWLKWDLGLPLFILGEDFRPGINRLMMVLRSFKWFLYLYFVAPRNYSNVLIVSAYANKQSTLDYWLEFIPREKLYLFPPKGNSNLEIDRSLVDLDLSEYINPNLPINHMLLDLLEVITQDLAKTFGKTVTKEQMEEALLKGEWEERFIHRVKQNLIT